MEEEEVRNQEEVGNSLSRRRVLKRAGVGAAVVWSAPVLTSLATPAHAQGASPQPGGCSAPCTACFCSGTTIPPSSEPCGGSEDCLCSATIEGDCFCAHARSGSSDDCTTSDDCLPNERCMTVCQNNCTTNSCQPACDSV